MMSLNLQTKKSVGLFGKLNNKRITHFVYRNNVLNSKTKVTLVCKNWPLEKALTHVFSPHGIQYSFNNNTIVLSTAPVAKERVESSEPKKAVVINEREQYTPEKNKISGVVLEANGDPIIGASVFVKGTTIGTATNTDGEFTIEAPANSVLSISYIGLLLVR